MREKLKCTKEIRGMTWKDSKRYRNRITKKGDKHKITAIKNVKSGIKIYTQIFKFNLKI